MSKKIPFVTRDTIDRDLLAHDYVAGRLSKRNRDAFEAQLAHDDALQEAVAWEREVADALNVHDTPSAAAFGRLAERLSGRPAPRPQHARPWRWAFLGGALAASIGLVFLRAPGPVGAQESAFRTLASPGGATPAVPAPAPEDGALLRLVFHDSVDETGRAALADRYGFEFTAPPEPSGAYVVRAVEPVSGETLRSWRQDPAIRFAEPARYPSP